MSTRYIERIVTRRFALVSALLLAAAPAAATDYTAAMTAYLESGEMAWMTDAAVLEAVRARNDVTRSPAEAEIIVRDNTWRAQVGTADTTLVHSVLDGATSDFLRAQVAASGGVIIEIIVMDAAGLNVAISHVTSDYWQGEEAKHQDTYGVGPDAVHFSEIELDESTQTYKGQISVTLVDPETGEASGAATVGVNALALS